MSVALADPSAWSCYRPGAGTCVRSAARRPPLPGGPAAGGEARNRDRSTRTLRGAIATSGSELACGQHRDGSHL